MTFYNKINSSVCSNNNSLIRSKINYLLTNIINNKFNTKISSNNNSKTHSNLLNRIIMIKLNKISNLPNNNNRINKLIRLKVLKLTNPPITNRAIALCRIDRTSRTKTISRTPKITKLNVNNCLISSRVHMITVF